MFELEITSDRRPEGRVVVTVKGAVDAHTFKRLDHELEDLIKAKYPWVVLDLTALDYISSSGMMMLLTKRGEARKAGGELVIVKPKPQVYQVFTMIGFHDLLAFVPTPDEALAALTKLRPSPRKS